MVINIKENGDVIMLMDMVYLKVLMDRSIRANGEMTINMEKVLRNGLKV
jgi:hypothetical protein